jgi:hypothetical protein
MTVMEALMKMTIEGVVFDDFTVDDGEQITRWSQVCQDHVNHFQGTNAIASQCAGEPICGVEGCDNIAEYYLDFIDADYDFID